MSLVDSASSRRSDTELKSAPPVVRAPLAAHQDAVGPSKDDIRLRTITSTVLLLLFLWTFLPLLSSLWHAWTTQAQYSHGFLIPLMALGIGWTRLNRVDPERIRGSFLGPICLLIAVIGHLYASWLYIEAADSLAFVVGVTGIVLSIWGVQCVRAMWPALAFLVFMFPLPYRYESLLSTPLQLIGTDSATWLIQMLGIPAIAQGTLIHIGETRLGVAEACSGMRMLMVFFAIATAAAMVLQRSGWERILIVSSAVPIALICNIARIVFTAVAYHLSGPALADAIFHDFAGWIMMPAALFLLWLELRLVDWLFIEQEQTQYVHFNPI